MSSSRKSTSDRKSKGSHHSRSHRDRRSKRNTSEFIEPLYFVDQMLPHPNNVPLFFQTPFYGASQSPWNPVSPVGYINPPTSPGFPNVNHPPQLSIGPLYLLPEGRPINENAVILESAKSNPIQKNKPMQGGNLYERQNEANGVINTWKSQNRTKNILIDTPTQYEYAIPTSKRVAPSLSNTWMLENNGNSSETSYLTSLQNNESRNQLSEKHSGDSVFSEHPRLKTRENLTVMRVMERKDFNYGEGFNDLNSLPISRHRKTSHSTEASKLHRNIRRNCETPGKNNENRRKIYIEVPAGMNDLDKERSAFGRKSLTNGKVRTFNGMTTEDSINDLYRKINAIQSSLGASDGYGLVGREADHEAKPIAQPQLVEQCLYPRQFTYYSNDLPVTGTNAISRGISPINFKTIQNTGPCCCCCCSRNTIPCFERNVVEKGIDPSVLTRDIDTLKEFSNNITQCPSNYHFESGHPNDGLQYVKMHYPHSNTRSDIDLCVESFPSINKNIRIVIDQEAECQSPSLPQNDDYTLPIQEMCDRPCNCPQNTVPNSCAKIGICCDSKDTIRSGCPKTNEKYYCATKDNSNLCSSSDLPPIYGNQCYDGTNDESDECRSSSFQRSKLHKVQASQTSFEEDQSAPDPSNPPSPCHCDFDKELNNIMKKIEKNILSKLEKKRISLNDRAVESSPPDIQNSKKTRFSNTVDSRESDDLADLETWPRIVMEPYDTPPSNLGAWPRTDTPPSNLGGWPRRFVEPRDTPPARTIILDPRNNDSKIIIEQTYLGPPQELYGPTSGVLMNNQRHHMTQTNPLEVIDYEPEVSHRSPSSVRNRSVISRGMRGSRLGSRRISRFSSQSLRRSTRGLRPTSMYSTNPRYFTNRPGYRRQPYGDQIPRGPSIFNTLTAIPQVENVKESSKDESGDSKDDKLNDLYLEKDKLSDEKSLNSDPTVENVGKESKNINCYQIRKIKLSGAKKHIYILVKKRKNTSSRESQETFDTSTVRTYYLKRVCADKKSIFKDVKPKKLRKVFRKSEKES